MTKVKPSDRVPINYKTVDFIFGRHLGLEIRNRWGRYLEDPECLNEHYYTLVLELGTGRCLGATPYPIYTVDKVHLPERVSAKLRSENEKASGLRVVWLPPGQSFESVNSQVTQRLVNLYPIPLFTVSKTPSYFIYNASFSHQIESVKRLVGDDTFYAFHAGYVGITGRHPMERIQEHVRSYKNGDGYHFHASWRALSSLVGCDLRPTFSIISWAYSLEEAYDIEEAQVEKHTLAPEGLNAIPGGKAGLRCLHMLRQNKPLPSLRERDAALVELEKGSHPRQTHYRRGHVRNLPAHYKASKTWVSPCWVGVKQHTQNHTRKAENTPGSTQ